MCAKCVTICGFMLLTACIAALAGLVWVHVELKKEVDILTSRLNQGVISDDKYNTIKYRKLC